MPGFTHLQVAQPVTLGHHLLAYYEMLRRDRSRFADARARLNESPLGAAALAGTGFPIDREATARALGFDRPTANSLDAVSDRDFALDYLSAARPVRAASLAPRRGADPLGEPAVRLRHACPTTSRPARRSCRRSATPTRPSWCAGTAGGSPARWSSLMVTMKGLPLAYSKDMQDDKEPVFEAHDLLVLSLAGAGGDGRDARVRCRSGCAPPPQRASPPRPTSPTGWCARRACRSARRTTSPAAP